MTNVLETLCVRYTCTNPECFRRPGERSFEIINGEREFIEKLPSELPCTDCGFIAKKGDPYKLSGSPSFD